MSNWSDERSDLAKKLWTVDGFSASQIAKALGGVSRNAVIGRLCRMGLTGRGEGSRKRASALGERRAAAALVPTRAYAPRVAPTLKIAGHGAVYEQAQARPPRVVVPTREEAPGLRTVLTIRPFGECHFPIGDPLDPGFTLCGAAADGPYCGSHHRLTHVASPPAKPRPYAVRGG